MDRSRNKQKGFTLLETMLVLAVIGGIMVMALNYGSRQIAQQRRDKTALQMQQVLNAALAYYTANGVWPFSANDSTNPIGGCTYNSSSMSGNPVTPAGSLSTLSAAGFLPSNMSANAYGYPYSVACDSATGNVFYITTQFNNIANALIVSGELPVAYLSDSNGAPDTSGLYVTAQVTVPGQNLNNARSINFVGIYHNGACVPVPTCPGYDASTNACTSGTNCMIPQIMVSPVSASGVNTNTTYPSPPTAYPITSFTAYAIGPAADANMMSCPVIVPPAITPSQSSQNCSSNLGPTGIPSPSGMYWRVCMEVVTSQGVVSTTNTGTGANAWGLYGTVIALTRCSPPNEPFGSDFSIYTQ